MSSRVIRRPASAAAATSAAPIAFGSAYGVPSGLVVHVVELADARDAGQHHLAEHRPREPVVRVGVERAGQPVHLVAPRPERALRRPGCGRAAPGGTRGCARWPDPGSVTPRSRTAPGGGAARRARPPRCTPSRTSMRTSRAGSSPPSQASSQWNTASPAIDRQLPTRRTNSVIRSTNAARWKRSNCSHVVNVVGSVHPVEEQHAVEVVELVLEGAGGEPALDLVVRHAVAVEVAHADVDVAHARCRAGWAPTGTPR